MSKSVDVLNLEWSSYASRDRTVATLVCNYLRKLNLNVIEGSIFNGLSLLYSLRPKLLFVTNSVGAPENLQAVKYAKHLGIKVLTLISEGTFQDDDAYFLKAVIWGWNKDQVLYEDIHMQWSKRTQDLTNQLFPQNREKVKVSGGVFFDCYKLEQLTSRNSFLIKWGKDSFKKIIGVGLFDFGCVCNSDDHRFPFQMEYYGKKQMDRFIKDRDSFNAILTEVIRKNPNILFLLKQHPGTLQGFEASAIEGLSNEFNVLIIKNEESIIDCIAASDFWLVYESTTAMEAWLLNRSTCLLNPSGRDFLRDIVNLGSPAVTTCDELNNLIQNFYKNEFLPGFIERADEREMIIKRIIQWDDGLNHVRVANQIVKLIKEEGLKSKVAFSFRFDLQRWKEKIKWILSRHLFKIGLISRTAITDWDQLELEMYVKKMKHAQEFFYLSLENSHLNFFKVTGL